jgi:hypothetical protein
LINPRFCPPAAAPHRDRSPGLHGECPGGGVDSAAAETTILLADGTYALDGGYLRFEVAGVTLRSASRNREAVVLDGNYLTTEIIQIVASGVTVADLTLRERDGATAIQQGNLSNPSRLGSWSVGVWSICPWY